MDEEGLRGSWYKVRVLEAGEGDIRVEHQAFTVSEERDEPVCEWVSPSMLRPLPPPSPPDFISQLTKGDPIEQWHEDGWWEVQLIRKLKACDGKDRVEVSVERYGGYMNELSAAHIRPVWEFTGSSWKTAAPRGFEVYEQPWEVREAPPSTIAGGGGSGIDADVLGGGGRCGRGTGGDQPAALQRELASYRQQNAELLQLAENYRKHIEELRGAARSLFPLAQAAVSAAGGMLNMPECISRPAEPLPKPRVAANNAHHF